MVTVTPEIRKQCAKVIDVWINRATQNEPIEMYAQNRNVSSGQLNDLREGRATQDTFSAMQIEILASHFWYGSNIPHPARKEIIQAASGRIDRIKEETYQALRRLIESP